MPCVYYTTEEYLGQAREKLNKLTQLLCNTCKRADSDFIADDPYLLQWWTEHQEEDRKREEGEKQAKADKIARENARNAALAKLTDEDRKALNIEHY